MLKELKHEIKAVLEHQLINLRKHNTDTRAPSHDLAGLRSTYSFGFEKGGNNTRPDEMLKTGQVPVEVNAMTSLVLDESEDEGGEMSGDVKAL